MQKKLYAHTSYYLHHSRIKYNCMQDTVIQYFFNVNKTNTDRVPISLEKRRK